MGTSRLPVDETPSLNGRFLRIRFPSDNDTVIERPLGRLLLRICPQDVGKELLERLVDLELSHDLRERLFCQRPCLPKKTDGDLFADRVIAVRTKNVLDRLCEGDDRRFVVFASPKVEPVVGIGLDLAAAIEDERLLGVSPSEYIPQEEVEVVPGEPA